MTVKKILASTLLLSGVAVGSVWAYNNKFGKQIIPNDKVETTYVRQANYPGNNVTTPMIDFEKAAAKASPTVVHIKTIMQSSQNSDMSQFQDQLKDFFGPGFGGNEQNSVPAQRASGSGVLISADGYIVTNNHVVEGASKMTVTLNDKNDYEAKVIGTDPSTDLAVIKIDAKNLPFITFSNSDEVHVGQWVLAIGYPLNLETTVTSGIVSAKARNIGINSRNSSGAIESFIQTDAAVNPGNSGGALVNTDGDLIGINSAIASPTGSYAGYAYAIPSNLVRRVVNDIIKYGSPKRAYLGIMLPSDQLSAEERAKNNIKEGAGVYVMDVSKGSAAEEAGIHKGDFITRINGVKLNSGTELMGQVGSLHPGDKIEITYTHDGDEKTTTATLKGSQGNYASAKTETNNKLGAIFENLSPEQAAQLNLKSGVVVKQLSQGALTDQTRIQEGFIITKVNGSSVSSVEELNAALKNAGNNIILTGVYPQHPNEEYKYALNDLNR